MAETLLIQSIDTDPRLEIVFEFLGDCPPLGIPEKSIVDLEYFDYARPKYLALGMKDTMPPKTITKN